MILLARPSRRPDSLLAFSRSTTPYFTSEEDHHAPVHYPFAGALKRVAAKSEHARFGGTQLGTKKAIVSFARLRASLAFGHRGAAAWRLQPTVRHSCSRSELLFERG